MNYKLTARPTTVVRIEDGAYMSVDHPDVVDWLAAGNTLLPADPPPEPTAQQVADDQATAAFRLGWVLGQARLGAVALNGIQRQMDTIEAQTNAQALSGANIKILAEAVEDIANQLQILKRFAAIQAEVPDR